MKIKNKNSKVTIKKKYGPQLSPSCALYSSGGDVLVPIFLHHCTNPPCKNVEKEEKEYKRCSVCKTIYCSRECAAKDWTDGKHKKFCLYESYWVQRDLWMRQLEKQGHETFFGIEKYDKVWNKRDGKKYKKGNDIPKDYKPIYQKYY